LDQQITSVTGTSPSPSSPWVPQPDRALPGRRTRHRPQRVGQRHVPCDPRCARRLPPCRRRATPCRRRGTRRSYVQPFYQRSPRLPQFPAPPAARLGQDLRGAPGRWMLRPLPRSFASRPAGCHVAHPCGGDEPSP
jgi:hypothetical protein